MFPVPLFDMVNLHELYFSFRQTNYLFSTTPNDTDLLESVAQFPAGSGRNRFCKAYESHGHFRESWSTVFHASSHQRRRRRRLLMEDWGLTPRGLPMLLLLFMSDDIATLLIASAHPKMPRCSLLRPRFRVFEVELRWDWGEHVLQNEICCCYTIIACPTTAVSPE